MQTIIISENINQAGTQNDPISLRKLATAVTPVGLGQSALLVYLPILVETTPLDYGQWAQLFALGMAFYFAGSIAWPLLLPRLGYGVIIRSGLWGYCASMLLLGLSLMFWHERWLDANTCIAGFALSRILYGIFASALLPSCQSGCAQMSKPEDRLASFSIISLHLSLSRLLGPVVTLVFASLHWLGPISILLIWPALLLFLLRKNTFPKTEMPSKSCPQSNWLAQLKTPYSLALIAMASTAFASSLQFMAAPIMENLFTTSAQNTAKWLGALMIGAALISALAHRLQTKHPSPSPQLRMLLIAILLAICGLALLVELSQTRFIILVLICSAGLAWLTPLYSTQLSLHNTQHHQVAAQLSLTHLAGHFVGLNVCAILLNESFSPLFLWLSTLGFIMTVAVVSWVIPTQRRNHRTEYQPTQ